MLRIIQTQSAAQAKSYYSHSDYYTEDQELAGVWKGKGAERLGLCLDPRFWPHHRRPDRGRAAGAFQFLI